MENDDFVTPTTAGCGGDPVADQMYKIEETKRMIDLTKNSQHLEETALKQHWHVSFIVHNCTIERMTTRGRKSAIAPLYFPA